MHSLAQSHDHGFQVCNALIALRERRGDIGGLEALRDVLRTVRVPGGNGEEDHLFGARLVAFRHQLCDQLGVAFDDARLAPNLDAPPVRIIDQEEIGLRIVGEIAVRDVLPVAAKSAKPMVLSSSTCRKPGGPPRCWM